MRSDIDGCGSRQNRAKMTGSVIAATIHSVQPAADAGPTAELTSSTISIHAVPISHFQEVTNMT